MNNTIVWMYIFPTISEINTMQRSRTIFCRLEWRSKFHLRLRHEVFVLVADSNEIWVSVLPGSGDFVVTLESRKEGKNTVEETNKMLYSGKIKALENPRYDSKFKELSMNNEALRTVDFDSINRCFSSKINDDQSYAGTRIFELQECQRGKPPAFSR